MLKMMRKCKNKRAFVYHSSVYLCVCRTFGLEREAASTPIEDTYHEIQYHHIHEGRDVKGVKLAWNLDENKDGSWILLAKIKRCDPRG